MPEKPFLQHGGAKVYIETVSTAGGDEAMGMRCTRVVQELAKVFGNALEDLKEGAPDEVSISFGLGVSNDGQFTITRSQTTANFVISFRWGAEQSMPLPIPLKR